MNQTQTLEKQGYRFAGNHSAVKLCLWTKHAINSKGMCYKNKFYGLNSSKCIQMTSSMYCANRCTFCWRSAKAPVSKKWVGKIDNPKLIVDEAIKKHIKLLQGFKGDTKISKEMLKEMEKPRHAALSLTGDSITYPKIQELLDEFHKRKISTFLVTNAQYPEQIKKIKRITQLYISLDAPNKELLKKIDKPLFNDFYERLIKSLKEMKKKKFRTTIRLTLIKGLNDNDLKGYSKLIHLANPDFVEVKGYSWLGESRNIHKQEEVPTHNEVKQFSIKLADELKDFKLEDEHEYSSAVLLINKRSKHKRIIDFNKLF